MREKVFVTDASYKHTLGIVRSLGRRGLEVYCGASDVSPALSSFSRYTIGSLIYPDPKKHPDLFKDFIHKTVNKLGIDIVIPVGYNATVALSQAKNELKVKIPVSDFASISIAASKERTVTFAEMHRIPVPKTIIPASPSDSRIADFEFPVVVKGVYESGFVKYAYDQQTLKQYIDYIYGQQGVYPLIQEYIPGDNGFGFFALFNHGSPRAIFMHKRIRMYPITGGQSTCAESIFEPRLLKYGETLLKALNWHGVAMVEFKKDVRDGEFKLMEINPKFWGSLDLAIASGMDFPQLLYTMASDGDVKTMNHYLTGVRFMWPFPDDFYRVIDKPTNINSYVTDLLNSRISKNIDFSDLRPNLMQLAYTVSLLRNLSRWSFR
jgi:predicted ATP-grasp superfamily ATP-dependent carboligase